MTSRLAIALVWAPLLLLTPLPLGAETRAQGLYTQYEALNTPENLKLEFAGGLPLPFVKEQIKLLAVLRDMGTDEAAPVVAKIVDEYLGRVRTAGEAKFRTSPLQALQLAMEALIARHASSDEVFQRARSFYDCPSIAEYARGRMVGVLVGKQLSAIKPGDDPTGRQRARVLLDTVIGDMSFALVVRAPARLRQLPDLAPQVAATPLAFREALAPFARSIPARYAVDYAYVAVIGHKQTKEKQQLLPEEKKALLDVCSQWIETYKPLVDKESFPSDVLGGALAALGGYQGNEDLAGLLKKHGVAVVPYTEPRPIKTPPIPK